jgi:hypothetical protein
MTAVAATAAAAAAKDSPPQRLMLPQTSCEVACGGRSCLPDSQCTAPNSRECKRAASGSISPDHSPEPGHSERDSVTSSGQAYTPGYIARAHHPCTYAGLHTGCCAPMACLLVHRKVLQGPPVPALLVAHSTVACWLLGWLVDMVGRRAGVDAILQDRTAEDSTREYVGPASHHSNSLLGARWSCNKTAY